MTTIEQVSPKKFDELYVQIQQFYAYHMRMLDSGAAQEWADTFTEDGIFEPPSAPSPIVGRAALAAGVREAVVQLAALGEQHRHILISLDVTPGPDGKTEVRSYAQIVATLRGGSPRIHLMCAMHDHLVTENGELRVAHRRVTRDDRP